MVRLLSRADALGGLASAASARAGFLQIAADNCGHCGQPRTINTVTELATYVNTPVADMPKISLPSWPCGFDSGLPIQSLAQLHALKQRLQGCIELGVDRDRRRRQ